MPLARLETELYPLDRTPANRRALLDFGLAARRAREADLGILHPYALRAFLYTLMQ